MALIANSFLCKVVRGLHALDPASGVFFFRLILVVPVVGERIHSLLAWRLRLITGGSAFHCGRVPLRIC